MNEKQLREKLIEIAKDLENDPESLINEGYHFMNHTITHDGTYNGSKLCVYYPGLNVYVDTDDNTISTACGVSIPLLDSEHNIYKTVMDILKSTNYPCKFHFEG